MDRTFVPWSQCTCSIAWVHDFLLAIVPTLRCLVTRISVDGGTREGERIIEEIAEHAARYARIRDQVDEWVTSHQLSHCSYGGGQFPPGQIYLVGDFERLMTVYRNYLRAHVAIYDAIKANDLVDADGDRHVVVD